jgi:hypothetical protein
MKYQPLLAGAALLLLLAHAGCRGPSDAPEAERLPCRLPTAMGDTTWQDGVGLALTLADSTGLVPKNCFAEGEDIGFVLTVFNQRNERVWATVSSPRGVFGPDGRHINEIRPANYFRVSRRNVEGEELVGVASKGMAGYLGSAMFDVAPRALERFAAYWLPYPYDRSIPQARLLGEGFRTFAPSQNRPLPPGDYMAEIEDEKIFIISAPTNGQVVSLPSMKFRLRVPFRVQAR